MESDLHCLVCVCVCMCVLSQRCLTPCDPMNRSPPGSSVQGILQAGMLEWVAILSSKGSLQERDKRTFLHLLH